MLERFARLAHAVGMRARLVRKRAFAHVRLPDVMRDIGDLGDENGHLGEPLSASSGIRRQPRLSCRFGMTVHRLALPHRSPTPLIVLGLDGAFADRKQRIRAPRGPRRCRATPRVHRMRTVLLMGSVRPCRTNHLSTGVFSRQASAHPRGTVVLAAGRGVVAHPVASFARIRHRSQWMSARFSSSNLEDLSYVQVPCLAEDRGHPAPADLTTGHLRR